jgi:nucleoside-diphosphate-sugar epimerase
MKKILPKSNWLDTSILVTGSDGFIGRHLVESFIKRGYKVFAKCRSDGDVRNIETWKKYPKADCVVHLAGLTFVPDSWINPELFISSNSGSTNNSLEYCRTNDAKLVFPSIHMRSQSFWVKLCAAITPSFSM